MKLVFVDSRHNFFHWLAVVSIRTVYSLILIPLSAYVATVGFFLSVDTLQSLLPAEWIAQITFYSSQLPFLPSVKRLTFQQLNHWYKDAPVWWAMVVGLPLIIMGICVFSIGFFNLFHSIASPLYNRAHCPFCKEPLKAVKAKATKANQLEAEE